MGSKLEQFSLFWTL